MALAPITSGRPGALRAVYCSRASGANSFCVPISISWLPLPVNPTQIFSVCIGRIAVEVAPFAC